MSSATLTLTGPTIAQKGTLQAMTVAMEDARAKAETTRRRLIGAVGEAYRIGLTVPDIAEASRLKPLMVTRMLIQSVPDFQEDDSFTAAGVDPVRRSPSRFALGQEQTRLRVFSRFFWDCQEDFERLDMQLAGLMLDLQRQGVTRVQLSRVTGLPIRAIDMRLMKAQSVERGDAQ